MPGSPGLLRCGTTNRTRQTLCTAYTGEHLLSRNIHTSAELRVLSSPLPFHLLGEHRRCAFNSAVQLMARMPDISKYLKKLCSSDCDALTLHRALDKQLDGLAAAIEAKKVAFLDELMSALDKVAGLRNFAQRSRQDLLCAPAACLCPCAWIFSI